MVFFLLYLLKATTTNEGGKNIQGKKLFAEIHTRLAKITPNNFHDKTKFSGVPALHGFLYKAKFIQVRIVFPKSLSPLQ